jgi:REP element-mobilizing transposase RayT
VKYDPDQHHRRSIRLPGYDYSSPGAYFITICTRQKECILGEILDGIIHLHEFGQIAADCWQWLSERYAYVELDEWVVMPNHIHGIIRIADLTQCKGGSRTALTIHDRSHPSNPTKYKPIGRLIGVFKTVSSKKINQIRNTPGCPVWQRNYYEHIIRDRSSLQTIRQYISNNPLSWELDSLHPSSPPRRNLLG